jgi:hypothetical protein
MQRSLNPRASGGNLSAAPPLLPSSEQQPRRNILAAILATIIGGIISLFPLGAGALVFLDPILRGKKDGSCSVSPPRTPFRRTARRCRSR